MLVVATGLAAWCGSFYWRVQSAGRDQPAVIGELLAGLLGPSVLGLVAPQWYGAVFPADQVLRALLSASSLFLATGIRPVGQEFMGHRAERVVRGASCAAVVMSS